MNKYGDITLLVFTSEGREHLLAQTFPSFKSACGETFFETIISVDGPYDVGILKDVKHDKSLYHYKRQGYVQSIIATLKMVNTPYLFLLEDDFIFKQEVPLDEMRAVAKSGHEWASIFLSRGLLTKDDEGVELAENIYKPAYGLSMSPALFNTEHLRSAFDAMSKVPKDINTAYWGFEPFIDNYFSNNGLKYGVVNPGQTPHVEHIGWFESTAREYHMINSLDDGNTDVDKRFLSGFGKDLKITAYNRLTMLPKLWLAATYISFKLLFDRRAYDAAFRVYISFLRKFKY